jgi:DNA-binding CsgD family transcriptional regulator
VEIRRTSYLSEIVRLGVSDMERVARFSAEVAAAEEVEPFPSRLLESFRLLVGSEFAGYCELDRVGRRDLAMVAAPEPDEDGTDYAVVFWRLRHQYPTCVYEDETGDFSSRKLSDFITLRELHHLEIYADFFRPAGIEHEIGVGLPAPLTHTKVFLFANGSAHEDFNERERSILDLLRPLLTLRYRQTEARRRADAAVAALETSDEALVLLDNAGKAEFATLRALRLLASNGLTLNEVPRIEPLLAHAVRPGVLLLSERRPFGLTNREREILALIAEGRTNAEVATALWISPATVRKHLENAYTKLGVTTRTAAVHCAREHRIIAS